MIHTNTRFLFIALLGWLVPFVALAQSGQISGTIVDAASNEPVGYASAALLKHESLSYINGMQTKEDGKLLFADVEPGRYSIRVTYVGYETYLRTDIVVAAGQQVDLGNIPLEASGELLEEVVVVGTTPAMELGIDRRVFNVAQSTISVGGNATDLLANVPSLQVDMDGSVSLRGSSSVRILIDGRESAMAGSDVTQLLQALPANSIEKIEVITNPSSKYDAEGQSGIINIVLKKDIRQGLNGNLSASAGSYNNYQAGATLNYRDYKFNWFGGYSFNRRNMVGSGINNSQFANGSVVDNQSENINLGRNHNIRGGVDYFLGDRTTIGVSGVLSIRGNNRDQDIYYQYFNNPSLSGTSERLSRQSEDDLGYDLAMDVKHQFSREGEELVANVAYGYDTEDGVNTFDQTFTDPLAALDSRINRTDELGRNMNFQLDYVRPFNEESKLEAGYRTMIRRSEDGQYSERFLNDDAAYVPDYSISNEFNMESIVHALYTNYQNKFTDNFGVQLGLRAEQAYLNTEYFSVDPSVPVGDRMTPGRLDYFRLYPSLFLTQEFGDRNQLQLSYTRRVSRPRGWQVNPFINVSDPLNIRQGNPNMMPEDIHSMELSYGKLWDGVTLTSSAYYRLMNDVIQPIIIHVDDESSATTMQWNNISRNETAGFELISQINISKDVDVMANANFSHTRFHGSPEFDIEPNEGFNWNANATANYRIIPNLSAQVRAEYRAPRVMAQGKGIATTVIDAGLRLDVLNRRGSIMFNARDLLDQRRFGGFTDTGQVYRYFESRWMRRTFTLSFSYRFGGQNMQQRDERPRSNEMDDFGGGEGF